ncbi:hypothetical protein [Clostridioides difficile]|nr:hypothetical protein [Clostridioides difficile]
MAKDNTISLDGNAMYKFNIVDFNNYNNLKKKEITYILEEEL